MTGTSLERDNRPWGYYDVLADLPDCKVKRIVVFPGSRLSLQRHNRRDEHWFVVSGRAVATVGKGTVELSAGGVLDIPRLTLHRIWNSGTEDFVFIEVQVGAYFGEDDIERFEDDYGRA